MLRHRGFDTSSKIIACLRSLWLAAVHRESNELPGAGDQGDCQRKVRGLAKEVQPSEIMHTCSPFNILETVSIMAAFTIRIVVPQSFYLECGHLGGWHAPYP